MSATGLQVFDDTLHKTNTWLKEVMEEVGSDRQRAYQSLRAVLHALRDRLTTEEAAHLSAQLPMLVRGIYFEGWSPSRQPTGERSREEFLAAVAARLDSAEPINPETATRAVFQTVDRHVTPGEAEEVKGMLNDDIRSLWPVH